MGAITPSCGLLDVPAELLHEICASPREYYALIRTCKHLWHAYTQNGGTLAWVAAKHFPNMQQFRPDLTPYPRYRALRLTDQNFMTQQYTSSVLEDRANLIQKFVTCPDGRLAIILKDGTVRICNRECQHSATLQHEGSRIGVLAAFQDGRLVSGTLGYFNGEINIWNSANTCIATYRGHTKEVTALAPFLDGWLASAALDGEIRIWNSEGVCTVVIQEPWNHVLVVCPKGELASGSGTGTITIWNREGQRIATLEGHTKGIHVLAACPNGLLASSAFGEPIRIWNIERGKCTAVLQGDGETNLWDCFAVCPNGTLVSVAFGTSTIKMWNINSGECIAKYPHSGSIVELGAFPEDGRLAIHGASSTSAGFPKIEIRAFECDFNTMLAELAEHLANAPYQNPFEVRGALSGEDTEVMERFSRVPLYAQKLIYVELAKLLHLSNSTACGENAFWGRGEERSTPQQRAQAIRAYLANQAGRSLAQRITDFVFTLFTTAWDWVRYGLHCLTCWRFAVAPVEAMPGAPPAVAPLQAPVLAG